MKNNSKRQTKEFRIKKVSREDSDTLYVKWKGYNNSFNCWIDNNDIIQ